MTTVGSQARAQVHKRIMNGSPNWQPCITYPPPVPKA